MYDVADFIKPVPYNPERNGECLQGEAQSLEYFRYARTRAAVADLIRAALPAICAGSHPVIEKFDWKKA